MKRYKLIVFSILSLSISCVKKQSTVEVDEIKIKAPFEMPSIKIPDFSNCKKFLITDFGAEKGDKEATSFAIEAAITEANKNGGGIVVIPAGEWLTNKIHFKSNVNLHLNEGAILLFSENPQDYLPPVQTTWEGMECYNYSPLIYAFECKNIAITGKGTLQAKMDVWKEWFARPEPHLKSLKRLYYMSSSNKPVVDRQMVNDSAHFRPQFIQFNRSENILLDGISIVNSPFWTIHPYLSKNIVIRNLEVTAHGHNNDGVDPEMSQNILIENCVFDQGDDAIAIKSGRNQDAWRLNTPSKNIVMRNCTIKNGHQLLAIGSELSGGVENVIVENCTVLENAEMFNLVFVKTNERRGGYAKNIFVQNIKAGTLKKSVLGIETDVLYQWRNLVPTIEKRLTTIGDVYISDIKVDKAMYVSRIIGDEALPVNNVVLTNIAVDSLEVQKYNNENITNFTGN
ncbi:glycoside hydrolase family 28 protein [Zobellia alginiliquefaciens]|uniref:glycoside hydrolase family 28 protein n=1 Tax=Zobellia alginiliquefaciens TaxID=3032586 RepID=UPI0023E3848C|nr:glycoside hydrolase family 28 protein [Zobellia alginiliquefaciens]